MTANVNARGFRVTTGDATGKQLAILLPTSYRVLHVASAADAEADWNVANPTHPTFYVHSETTPATDYIAFDHDATDGTINVASGNLKLALSGTDVLTLTTAALSPTTTDTGALGTSALMWEDLFLALGGVINFNNGDVTLTHAANQVTVGGGDVLIADGFGQIIGHTAQIAAGAVTSEFQMHGTAPADSTALLAAWSADAVPPRLYFAKSRSATIGTFGIITSGDNLGEILAFGDDGVDFNSNGNAAAAIIFDSAGTIAADRVPGQILIQTATDAAPSVLTTAITISPAQAVTFAGTVAMGANNITSTGSLSATGSRLTKWWATDGTSTNALSVDSSETVKHDIAPYEGDALGIVNAIDVITFKHDEWLDPSERTKMGLRAESVREPLAVQAIERPDGGTYPGVNMYGLETLLTRAFQQLSAKVERLEGAMA